jgi:hypothetical protein
VQFCCGRHVAGQAAARTGSINKKELNMTDETRKTNLRANAIPTDGYVLSVDGKLKTRYETSKEAVTAGTKLKQSFPAIQISVFDAAQRIYTPLDAQE